MAINDLEKKGGQIVFKDELIIKFGIMDMFHKAVINNRATEKNFSAKHLSVNLRERIENNFGINDMGETNRLKNTHQQFFVKKFTGSGENGYTGS